MIYKVLPFTSIGISIIIIVKCENVLTQEKLLKVVIAQNVLKVY